MGQKTHPVGYRLIVNKKWLSNWFAPKNNFCNELEEDVRIRKYISHRLPNAGISKVEIARTSKKVTITIHTARPGIVIGRGGEKKISYRRVVNKTIQATMRMGAEGIRVNVAGRLGGVEIARSEKFSDGSVPLHTLRADIDYALTVAHTAYGVIGIKVWICNGQYKR